MRRLWEPASPRGKLQLFGSSMQFSHRWNMLIVSSAFSHTYYPQRNSCLKVTDAFYERALGMYRNMNLIPGYKDLSVHDQTRVQSYYQNVAQSEYSTYFCTSLLSLTYFSFTAKRVDNFGQYAQLHKQPPHVIRSAKELWQWRHPDPAVCLSSFLRALRLLSRHCESSRCKAKLPIPPSSTLRTLGRVPTSPTDAKIFQLFLQNMFVLPKQSH